MSEIRLGRKAAYIALMIANAAVDLLLPTVMLFALAPTGMPPAVRLAVGGTLLSGKAIGGRAESGRFRWRLAVVAALLPAAAIVGSYALGLGNVPSMVIGAIASGVIVLADLLRSRWRDGSKHRVDVFAVVVLIEVAASVVLTSINGDARFVLARISIYLAIGGIVILATTWSERPLMRTALKPVASQGDPARAEAFDRAWQHSRQFRTLYRAMTASLGGVLIVDAVLRVVIIYSQSADAVARSSLSSQLPLIILIAVWFAVGRGLAVPRAMRLLEAELANGSAK
ncbi:VC0807 family protein [Nonomuraea helvata]|uniref:VC0807 family protein n=1 Tax=Nonomuraea helvata TaxID=37484 RepID=A0ABV5S5D8_9ACTN